MTPLQVARAALDAIERGEPFDYLDRVVAPLLREVLAQQTKPIGRFSDAPERIFLQVCDDPNCDEPFDAHFEICWCTEEINSTDVPYVRADLVPPKTIFCPDCQEHTPLILDRCRDARTGEPFVDLVCGKCRLVVASVSAF